MPSTATAFPLRLRLHYKAAYVGGVDPTVTRTTGVHISPIDFNRMVSEDTQEEGQLAGLLKWLRLPKLASVIVIPCSPATSSWITFSFRVRFCC
jgi:hypothetical protein